MIVTRRRQSSTSPHAKPLRLLRLSGVFAVAAVYVAACGGGGSDDVDDTTDTAKGGNTTEPSPASKPTESQPTESQPTESQPSATPEPSGSPTAEGTPTPGPAEPVEGPDVVVGTFAIELSTEGTGVQGKVKNGEDAANMVWDKLSSVGDCQVSVPRIPACDPVCADTEACVETDTCRAVPTSINVGDVLVSGVSHGGTTDAVKLRSIVKNYQTPADVKWDDPPFAPGDPISVAASGADVAAFQIKGEGISPIDVTSDPPEMAADKPIELTWEPESGSVQTQISVRIDVSHHGGTRGLIECETQDDGELSIDASLVKDLMDQGVSGFPNIRITRSNIGSAQTAVGIVELHINSIVQQDVSIEGILSCNTTDDCTDGSTCAADRVCR
ncbi:MAG TPA: hypothetical protein VHM70_02805 [Polyangiaceae bacterium]|nr:hypothetical protein [Polyangiaceae bacterium]